MIHIPNELRICKKILKNVFKEFSYPEYRPSSQIFGSEYLLTTDYRLQNNHHQQTLLKSISNFDTFTANNSPTNFEELKQRRCTSLACSLGQRESVTTAQLMLNKKTMQKLKLKKNQSIRAKWRDSKWTGEKVRFFKF